MTDLPDLTTYTLGDPEIIIADVTLLLIEIKKPKNKDEKFLCMEGLTYDI